MDEIVTYFHCDPHQNLSVKLKKFELKSEQNFISFCLVHERNLLLWMNITTGNTKGGSITVP